MNRFIKNLAFILLPLVIWGLSIVVIDPYNYFNLGFVDKAAKKEAEGLNTLVYRTIDYINAPCENIIFGDSRTYALPLDEVEKLSGIKYKKLNTNAAKLNEIFDLFYLAHSHKPVKRVVIGINFNMFNKFGHEDRVAGVKRMLDNPFMYVYNKDVAQAGYSTLAYLITNKDPNSSPPMSRQEFWDWSIETKATHWYGKYAFPDSLYNQLIEFDRFTKKNGIDVTFIIVPHHIEFHDRLSHFGLDKDEQNFKKIMSKLHARVYDFDYKNSITTNTLNFDDPIHYTDAIGNKIVKEVWSNNLEVGKRLDQSAIL